MGLDEPVSTKTEVAGTLSVAAETRLKAEAEELRWLTVDELQELEVGQVNRRRDRGIEGGRTSDRGERDPCIPIREPPACTRPTLGYSSRSVPLGFVLGPERLQPRGEPPAAELLGHGRHDLVRTGTKIHVDRVRAESRDPEERRIS